MSLSVMPRVPRASRTLSHDHRPAANAAAIGCVPNWDRVLESNGARRVVELERHDASNGTLAEDVAAEWAAGWAPQFA